LTIVVIKYVDTDVWCLYKYVNSVQGDFHMFMFPF